MVHIAPWAATLGLMKGAGQVLPPGGLLYLYGPYLRENVQTAPTNLAFDASLRCASIGSSKCRRTISRCCFARAPPKAVHAEAAGAGYVFSGKKSLRLPACIRRSGLA
jgi:hypothetical protein